MKLVILIFLITFTMTSQTKATQAITREYGYSYVIDYKAEMFNYTSGGYKPNSIGILKRNYIRLPIGKLEAGRSDIIHYVSRRDGFYYVVSTKYGMVKDVVKD